MGTTTWNNTKPKNKTQSRASAKGWKDIVLRVKDEIANDHVSIVAAGIAYYSILALIPALTSLVLIYAWISDPSEISQHLNSMSQIIPTDVAAIISKLLTSLSTKSGSTGIAAITTLLISLWSASKGMKALMEGLNMIYNKKEKREFIKLSLVALALTCLATLMGILAIGIIVGIPVISEFLNLGPAFKLMITSGGWILLLALFSFFLACTYQFGPSREKTKWKWISWGAIFSSLTWVIVSAAFSWYVSSFGKFDKSYGAMGAVIILLMWLYLSGFVVLIGGEINSELE